MNAICDNVTTKLLSFYKVLVGVLIKAIIQRVYYSVT